VERRTILWCEDLWVGGDVGSLLGCRCVGGFGDQLLRLVDSAKQRWDFAMSTRSVPLVASSNR
jgi:hypothetical protein